jgi:clan AA aspartic protease
MAIQGKVTAAPEPVVVLQTVPTKRKISVIIDTGFSGELCLSPSIIHRLGFERVGREAYILADGQIVHADIHKAEILWLNHKRSAEVIALENPQGLLGTQLLQQCTLTIHFKKRKVSINQERR